MKRIGLFVLFLLILFGLTFLLSLLFFPSWISQEDWPFPLGKTILIAGLCFIADSLIAKSLSFLFEDKEIKERWVYLTGRKYKDISERIDYVTKLELSKEKQSRKYIPNIFVESTEVKEKMRYFCEPYLFFTKIVENSEKEIRNSNFFNLLHHVHYPLEVDKNPVKYKKIRNWRRLQIEIEAFRRYLNQCKSITEIVNHTEEGGIKPEFIQKIPPQFSHILDYVISNLERSRSFEFMLSKTFEDLRLLTNSILVLKGNAGHGKTNLLCDFTENFLLRKGYKSIYLPAKEFNTLGNQESIEQCILRILFADEFYQFSDILNLIRFNKKINCIYILIDGINEHKDHSLFSLALEQFIQRYNNEKIKIILTCRSEYFEERFNGLLLLDNLSLLDLDDYYLKNNIPDIHQKTLVNKYFSEFKIQLNPELVSDDIIKVFNDDKLLLRIFCEAYENEKPTDYLNNLYKLEVFYQYYEKKQNVLPRLENCLDDIISWMLNNREFSNIKIDNFSKLTQNAIEETIYENIILRKDIRSTPDIAFVKFEVINFVYDEFRDFLLASKVITNWNNSNALAREQILHFTDYRSAISEGIQRYLCLWGIKNNELKLIDYLSSFTWFNLVFLQSVLDSSGRTHSRYIVDRLRQLFFSDPTSALRLIFSLLRRVNTYHFPVLNLQLLLNWLSELGEKEFEKLISNPLNEVKEYKLTYISYLSKMILNKFQKNHISKESIPQIVQLLCYLSCVQDFIITESRDNGLCLYPAYDVLKQINISLGSSIINDQISQIIHTSHNQQIFRKLNELQESFGET